MLRGHIDVVTSSGYIDGWAYDTANPAEPLALSILADGVEIAHGLANRYRSDLVEVGIGTGWCAFRFRTTGSIRRLSPMRLSLLVLPERQEISHQSAPVIAEDNDFHLKSVDEIVGSDPTLVNSVEQLRGCDFLFAQIIKGAGVDVFVRAAYIYVLSRPVDPTGLLHYGAFIRDGQLTPFGLLEALSDSDEFRSRPHLLIAPTQPGFIFRAL